MASKLIGVQRNPNTYWSLLNHLLNNKKILLLPPLFHEDKFAMDFKEKAELFNAVFAKQHSDNRLSSASFYQDDIAKISQSYDPNKAHRHDNINIRMLKIYDSSIYKPLEMILKQCTKLMFFLLNGK